MRSEKNPSWNGGCYDTKTEAEERLKQVEKFKHMKGGAMNREGGLPKTKRELKNYYCPECGEDSEIVFEPTPFISEITPYVCVSCGKNVIPVDRRTDKQIDVWKYWQHGKEKEGAVKDLIARIDRVIKLGAAERVFAADGPEEELIEWGLTEDGWNDKQLDSDTGIMEWIKGVERIAYELRNGRRGSYAKFGDTIEDLIQELENKKIELEEVIDRMDEKVKLVLK